MAAYEGDLRPSQPLEIEHVSTRPVSDKRTQREIDRGPLRPERVEAHDPSQERLVNHHRRPPHDHEQYTSSGILVSMNVGELIRDARTRAKLSQAALADRAKTSQPAIARYEAGTASPSLSTLERILAASNRSLVLSAPEMRRRAPRSSSGRRLALIRGLRKRLLAAAERHGIRNLRVFGSVAREDETPESDVDFLVDLDPERTVLDVIGFQQEAEDILGLGVDVAVPRMMKARVRTRAFHEARPI